MRHGGAEAGSFNLVDGDAEVQDFQVGRTAFQSGAFHDAFRLAPAYSLRSGASGVF